MFKFSHLYSIEHTVGVLTLVFTAGLEMLDSMGGYIYATEYRVRG